MSPTFIQDLSLRKSMHIVRIMHRIVNLIAVILMRFFESNLKIEHFTEKIKIFTEILLKNLKKFQRRGAPPPEPPTRIV